MARHDRSLSAELPCLTLGRFHPKENGYQAMASAIMAEVKKKLDIDYPPSVSPLPSKAKPKHSIQMLLGSSGVSRWWQIYQGPQGVAVIPCNLDDRFKNADDDEGHSKEFMYQNGANIDDPPYVQAGKKWPLKIDEEQEYYFELSADGPGFLKCGDHLELSFAADPQKGDPTVSCGAVSGRSDTVKWHRAWYVEY